MPRFIHPTRKSAISTPRSNAQYSLILWDWKRGGEEVEEENSTKVLRNTHTTCEALQSALHISHKPTTWSHTYPGFLCRLLFFLVLGWVSWNWMEKAEVQQPQHDSLGCQLLLETSTMKNSTYSLFYLFSRLIGAVVMPWLQNKLPPNVQFSG